MWQISVYHPIVISSQVFVLALAVAIILNSLVMLFNRKRALLGWTTLMISPVLTLIAFIGVISLNVAWEKLLLEFNWLLHIEKPINYLIYLLLFASALSPLVLQGYTLLAKTARQNGETIAAFAKLIVLIYGILAFFIWIF
jgi:hypothetical protein